MAIDVENLPMENYAVYQLILQKTNGNVSEFATSIGISQQRVNRLFTLDARFDRYPGVSRGITDAIYETYGISRTELFKPYSYRNVNKEVVDPLRGIPKNYSFTDTPTSNYVADEPFITDNYKEGKPFYDVPFTMGYDLPFNDNTANPTCMIDFRPYNKCDFWCRATGDSMYPTICDGDIVAVKQVQDFSRSVISRDIYAIVLYNDLRAIKRLIDNGDSFILRSDNENYEDQVVPKTDVRCVYRVMATLKMKKL